MGICTRNDTPGLVHGRYAVRLGDAAQLRHIRLAAVEGDGARLALHHGETVFILALHISHSLDARLPMLLEGLHPGFWRLAFYRFPKSDNRFLVQPSQVGGVLAPDGVQITAFS